MEGEDFMAPPTGPSPIGKGRSAGEPISKAFYFFARILSQKDNLFYLSITKRDSGGKSRRTPDGWPDLSFGAGGPARPATSSVQGRYENCL